MWRSRARALLLLLRPSIPRSSPPPQPPHPTRTLTRVPPPRPLSRFLSSSPDPLPDASSSSSDPLPDAYASSSAGALADATEAGEDNLSSMWEEAGDADDIFASSGGADAVADEEEVERVRAIVEATPEDKIASALADMVVDFNEPLLAAVLLAAEQCSCKKLILLFNYAAKNNPSAKSLSNLEILVSKVADSDEIYKMDAYLLWDLVKEIGTVPGLVSTPLLNEMIAIFWKLEKSKAALEVFAMFDEFGCTPDSDTYYLVIEAARKKSMFRSAWEVCEKMIGSGYFPNGEKVGKTLTFLCEGKKTKEAHSLFLAAKEKKIQIPKSALDFLVVALARNDETIGTALELLEKYQGESLKHAGKSFATVIHALCRTNKVDDANNLLTRMVLLEDYQGESLKNAGKTFATVIHGLCRKKKLEDAKTLLMRMVNLGPAPGKAVFNFVITALSKEGEMEDAKGLLRVMESQGLSPDIYTYSVLMSGYTKGGMVDEAHALLREAKKIHPKLNRVNYHILIRGYCKIEEFGKAIECLKEMRKDGLQPNVDEYDKLIQSLCLKATDWRTAEKLLEEMEDSGLCLKGISRSLIAAVKELEGEEMQSRASQ
ncbi:small ribosomal subunit protein mS80 (rPPR6)-like [Phragmites australis]|uniref:small ribosomal subunit protein mS80 (rPPR6)-like n=1 Tax=Phragmites australis TaxID=29695 RepID=UPI002D79FB72|nr:small ribosomal subunit protein mS80 (rPPR6)-like [Phragmites australis]